MNSYFMKLKKTSACIYLLISLFTEGEHYRRLEITVSHITVVNTGFTQYDLVP